MLDIGWQELFIIAIVTILVVGPSELPRVLRTVSGAARRIRQLAREFQDGLDDLSREADLQDIKKRLEEGQDLDVESAISRHIDPTGETTESIRDLDRSVRDPKEGTKPSKTSKSDDVKAAPGIPPTSEEQVDAPTPTPTPTPTEAGGTGSRQS